MDVILKQSGSKVGLYIDKQLATILENKNIKQATEWVKNNLKEVRIQIVK